MRALRTTLQLAFLARPSQVTGYSDKFNPNPRSVAIFWLPGPKNRTAKLTGCRLFNTSVILSESRRPYRGQAVISDRRALALIYASIAYALLFHCLCLARDNYGCLDYYAHNTLMATAYITCASWPARCFLFHCQSLGTGSLRSGYGWR